MITSGEIQSIASKLGVKDTQIEKDYVIGWVLKGISNNEFLKNNLLFKGGTAIRKVYVKDYRLSEDLDFTYLFEKLDVDVIKTEFEEVLQLVNKESRISLEISNENFNKTGNFNFYIGYIGPLGGKISKKDIKVDICDKEKICNLPDVMPVFNEYSDLQGVYKIKCYTIGEVISEKMRSLIQRTMPRDLYDLWYQLENEQNDILDYVFDFQEKTKFKGIDPDNFARTVNEKRSKFESGWNENLEKQIKDIPDFDKVWRELSRHFKKI